jgi:putative tryptophan/tyrosine transport system substrate-binding protein
MQRREFITLLGGAAAAWPIAARAQQPRVPAVVGFLSSGPPVPGRTAAFVKGLGEVGYAEGRSVAIEYRWADKASDRLPELAADLVRRRVAVIAAMQTSSALAAKAATSSIPIVFESAGDPVQAGLVLSLNRPGGNVTGISNMNVELGAKRLGFLHELLPRATRFAVLVNPNDPTAEIVIKDTRTAAAAIGRQIEAFFASTNREIDTAFAGLVQKRSDAVLVSPHPIFTGRRAQLVTLAAHHRMPAIYSAREYAEIGGLMTYGTSISDMYHQVGIYTGRVLKSEKPADLPVMQPTKFEFVINLQTAKLHGIEVPPSLLAIADEVIE